MTPITFQTGHVGLNVTDLRRSIKFYHDVFGFELLGDSGQTDREYAFMGANGNIQLTLWKQSSGAANHASPGLHHLSFMVPSVADVRDLLSRLRAQDVKLFHNGIVRHAEAAVSGGIYFEDPDGIRLEVFSPEVGAEAPAAADGAPACGFF